MHSHTSSNTDMMENGCTHNVNIVKKSIDQRNMKQNSMQMVTFFVKVKHEK